MNCKCMVLSAFYTYVKDLVRIKHRCTARVGARCLHAIRHSIPPVKTAYFGIGIADIMPFAQWMILVHNTMSCWLVIWFCKLCCHKVIVTKYERVKDKDVFFLIQVLTSLVNTKSTDDKIVRIIALPSGGGLIGVYINLQVSHFMLVD